MDLSNLKILDLSNRKQTSKKKLYDISCVLKELCLVEESLNEKEQPLPLPKEEIVEEIPVVEVIPEPPIEPKNKRRLIFQSTYSNSSLTIASLLNDSINQYKKQLPSSVITCQFCKSSEIEQLHKIKAIQKWRKELMSKIK